MTSTMPSACDAPLLPAFDGESIWAQIQKAPPPRYQLPSPPALPDQPLRAWPPPRQITDETTRQIVAESKQRRAEFEAVTSQTIDYASRR